jgi:hypothetical protein
MPQLDYGARTLCYQGFGTGKRLPGQPTLVVLSNEYRNITDGFGPFFAPIGPEIDIVVLEPTNMGNSTRIDRPLTPDEAVAEVEFFCRSLDILHPIFTGYCGLVELGFLCAQRFKRAGVLIMSPMMRTRDGHFVDHLFSVFKRAILSQDAQLISDTLMIVDPHSREHQANRLFPLVERHGAAIALKNHEHFWLQTQQNKPVGNWQWDMLPDYPHPVLLVRGRDDNLQIDSLMARCFVSPHHRISVVDSSHRILENAPEDVRAEIRTFMAACATDAAKAEPCMRRESA